MDSIRFIRDELQRAVHGPAWHGPCLLDAISGVDAAGAKARPVAGAHSIAEVAFHALAWLEEVSRRLDGSAPAEPERGDWPPAAELSDAGWSDVRKAITDVAAALDVKLSKLAPERLDAKVGYGDYDAPVGSGVTFAAMLHGVAQHTAYHGGQISLLKRALGS